MTASSQPLPTVVSLHLRTIATILWVNRLAIGFLLGMLAGQAALQPASAWITKRILDLVEAKATTVEQIVLDFGLLFIAIVGGLTALKFGEKVANKAVEVRLIITLQRIYLERRREEDSTRDVTQILWGCEAAKKGLEVFYKDGWKIVVTTISVLLWQVSLGAEWIPLMLMAVIPSLLLVWFFGPPIQRRSLEILNLQSDLAASTSRSASGVFTRHQESWFRNAVGLEILKWFADDGLDVIMWTVLGGLVLIAYIFDLGVLPDDIELGAAAAFMINVKLLAAPLSDIGKVYTKWREAYPAMDRAFTGAP